MSVANKTVGTRRVTVAITGASGAVYGVLVIAVRETPLHHVPPRQACA